MNNNKWYKFLIEDNNKNLPIIPKNPGKPLEGAAAFVASPTSKATLGTGVNAVVNYFDPSFQSYSTATAKKSEGTFAVESPVAFTATDWAKDATKGLSSSADLALEKIWKISGVNQTLDALLYVKVKNPYDRASIVEGFEKAFTKYGSRYVSMAISKVPYLNTLYTTTLTQAGQKIAESIVPKLPEIAQRLLAEYGEKVAAKAAEEIARKTGTQVTQVTAQQISSYTAQQLAVKGFQGFFKFFNIGIQIALAIKDIYDIQQAWAGYIEAISEVGNKVSWAFGELRKIENELKRLGGLNKLLQSQNLNLNSLMQKPYIKANFINKTFSNIRITQPPVAGQRVGEGVWGTFVAAMTFGTTALIDLSRDTTVNSKNLTELFKLAFYRQSNLESFFPELFSLLTPEQKQYVKSPVRSEYEKSEYGGVSGKKDIVATGAAANPTIQRVVQGPGEQQQGMASPADIFSYVKSQVNSYYINSSEARLMVDSAVDAYKKCQREGDDSVWCKQYIYYIKPMLLLSNSWRVAPSSDQSRMKNTFIKYLYLADPKLRQQLRADTERAAQEKKYLEARQAELDLDPRFRPVQENNFKDFYKLLSDSVKKKLKEI